MKNEDFRHEGSLEAKGGGASADAAPLSPILVLLAYAALGLGCVTRIFQSVPAHPLFTNRWWVAGGFALWLAGLVMVFCPGAIRRLGIGLVLMVFVAVLAAYFTVAVNVSFRGIGDEATSDRSGSWFYWRRLDRS